ncbi:MAG: D-2-hydroxyacid dehydrogenase [Rhodospirillales bacterium]|nr:D-2-hydroxyacid dehydrogenase [Rhodospirillales bacterium]
MTHAILHTDAPDEALALARARLPEVTFSGCDSYQALPARIAETGAEVVYSVRFAGTPGFPRAALVESGRVRWVSVGGSGTDHLAPWDPSHVTVTNAAGVAADMMAEYAIGALLHFSLDLPGFRRAQQRREWIAGKVRPIEGQRLLILGLGQTGQAIARRAKALGLHVTGMRARPRATGHVDAVIPPEALDAALPQADAVAVCLPLLDSTGNLLSAKRIAVLKPGAVLVDVSRGGVVDQTALASALAQGHLRGAALDVFEQEPLGPDSPFWAMEHVIVTPHCSSVYDGWMLKSVAMFCDNLARYLAGTPLTNIVDPTRGY